MAFSDSMKLVQALSSDLETLAALGAMAGDAAGSSRLDSGTLEKLKAVKQAIAPGFLDNLSSEELQFIHSTIRANLLRALELTQPDGESNGWAYDNPEILNSQGKASRVATECISEFAKRTPDLHQLLSEDSHFLDVGSGVGWISITMAENWPSLNCTGIDIHDPAIKIAETNRKSSSLGERVQFRNSNVTEINEEEKYSVVFIPIVFMPEQVVRRALPKMFQALVPGGWIFVASFSVPKDPLEIALTDLKTTVFGGRIWSEKELTSLISDFGFEVREDIGGETQLYLMAAKKPTSK
jgi:2-polyprenyl-3-methyl-5-hydroxy-6-metoxy-1,4-benzoquinol methylase